MPLLEHIIRLYAPHTCLGCGFEGDRLVCRNCASNLSGVPSRCYRCKSVTRDFAVCDRCKSRTPLRNVYVAQHHEGLSKQLLHQTKYERARAGLREMALRMAHVLSANPETVLVPVPTATSRVRQRGYDQSVLLARELSRETGLGRAQFLRRVGQAHQVGSGRKDRIRHLAHAFRVVRHNRLQGANVLLVDDVITTGATLETAARLLKNAGAARVDAVVFSQPS